MYIVLGLSFEFSFIWGYEENKESGLEWEKEN